MTTGDRSDPEVAAWLEWRSKNKASKPILTSVNRPPSSFNSLAAGVNRTQVQQAPKPIQQQQISQQVGVKLQINEPKTKDCSATFKNVINCF